MLEQIKIANFQCYESPSFTVDFDPFVTTIVGPTDCGKSTLLRAVRWVSLNKAPANIVNWLADFAKAQLKVDGRTILRHKGKTKNFYLLDDKQFDAVRSDVPGEIADLLNMDDGNFQRQLDPPFWFLETPGQVSRELNRIVSLDVIDHSLSEAAAGVRAARADVKAAEDRLGSAQAAAEATLWATDLNEDLCLLEGKQAALAEAEENTRSLTLLLNSLIEQTSLLDALQDNDQQRILDLLDKRSGVNDIIEDVERTIKQMWDSEVMKGDLYGKASRLEIELKKKMGGRCPLCGKSTKEL